MQPFLYNSRFKFIFHYIFIALAFTTVTRAGLMIYSASVVDWGLFEIIKVFAVGLFYDIVTLSYFILPFALYLALMPLKVLKGPIHRILALFMYFGTVYFFAFIAVSEYFFWEEFGVRFNFISVDYLIYTTEVMGNINESYPMPMIISTISVISLIAVWIGLRKKQIGFSIANDLPLKGRLKTLALMFALPVLFFYTVSMPTVSKNQYNTELAKNGIYCFFTAFRHNTIDYKTFYRSLPTTEIVSEARRLVDREAATFVNKDKDITREIKTNGAEKRHNVMMIVVESLSAEHITPLGGHKDISPYLDKLSTEGLFFRNLYATGTRTVRGMEALMLSVPPTPGRSVVKRPKNHNMYSAGFIFKERGYDTKFIYGGYGYFDNMNDFFSHNGFSIVDRDNFTKEEDTFHTAWGVCDEDLLAKAAKEADKSYAAKKPFMSFIMTTSNHRPFTYPEGRIDIPSHTNREGAVKYTDYAIGTFLEKVKDKPWFKDTIFVIVADHCASSAGEMELPVYKYHIPMFMYAPYILKPKNIDVMSSQVDVLPTIFSMLNWSYKSKFFGNDILAKDFKPRALIANYQKLGRYKEGVLDILLPKKEMVSYKVSDEKVDSVKYDVVPTTPEREKEIISIYQSATYFYDNNLNRYEAK